MSKDRSGRMRSPAEQHDDNLAAAQRRGVQLGEPYREARAVGASRYSRGKRDDFARLLDDITAGRFAADELWLWESSRGSRKVDEWVLLIGACEHAKVGIYVTTHNKLYDPGNARDRRSMLEDAVDAEYETAKTSERTSRGVRSRAAAGHPHGKYLYGYRREHDPATGTYARTVPDEAQATVVAEVFQRFADGESKTVIATSLTRRGVPTPGDSPVWRGSTLHSMLRNRGYLGERVSTAGHATVENAWPALVGESAWWRAQARLDDPGREPRRDMSVRWLLSGLAVCGKCGGKLVHNPGTLRTRKRAYPKYICADRRCLARNARLLEVQVVEYVCELWAQDERLGRHDVDPRIGEAEAELAALRAQLRMWQDSAGDEGVSPAAVGAAERKLAPRIEAAERQLSGLRARAAVPDLRGRSLREAWPGLTLAQQRTVIAASVTITVMPVGRGRRYDPATVVIRPRWG